MQLLIDRIETPIGEMLVVADEEGLLRSLDWRDYDDRFRRGLRIHYGEGVELVERADPAGLSSALHRYFAGELSIIDSLPVAKVGTTFQRDVWAALREIRCGTTISYSELARRIGKPSAVRAVGLANGSNPIGVVVPCHRVIGADGSLTGYGGGLERKRWLLGHESRQQVLAAGF